MAVAPVAGSLAPDLPSDVLLDVKDLSVAYRRDGREIRLVEDVTFQVGRGEALGLAGESGCGKTTTALALLGLLPTNLYRASGEIVLNSPDGVVSIHKRTERGMQQVRWARISMVFQGAMNSLDPVMRVSDQIAEAIRLHEPAIDRKGVDERIAELFGYVGISAARARQYPHEFSGGMRQRVMIALALACKPELIIGDEPTTALDVMMQAQILELLEELRRELGLAMILITHDLSVLAETCDRVAIMYAGQIAELGAVRDLYANPQHPYTQRLLAAFPAIGGPRELAPAIPGVPPDPADQPAGCRFAPRCHRVAERCGVEQPELRPLEDERLVRCHYAPWPAGGTT
jgi:peptide/nickel transport system ATP-binding protein